MSTASSVKPAFIEELLADNSANTERAERIASQLSLAQLRWRPAPNVWGVGHCLDHLRLGAEVYFPTLESTIERARSKHLVAPPDMQHRHSLMGRMLINAVSPESKKMKAPRAIVPPADFPNDVYERFQASQRRLGEFMESVAGLNVNRMRFSSPLMRIVRLNVADALEMLVVHAVRHLNQAEAVTKHPDFPTS